MPITLQENLRGVLYTPFYAALALGAYRREGVEVGFVSAPEPARAVEGLFAGTVDVAWGGPMRVMQTYDRRPDSDLVCFGEAVTRDPFMLIGREACPDFTLAEMKSGKDLYCAQQDNRTSEEVVYRMQVRDLSANGFVVAVENTTPVRSYMLTLFNPDDLLSLHFVERESPGVYRYYGLAFAGESLAQSIALRQASYVNRALALYGQLTGKAPPPVKQ